MTRKKELEKQVDEENGEGNVRLMEELNMENLPRKIWELKRTKRHVGWFHWGVLFVGIVLIVYSQSHDTVAIEVPVYDAALMQRYQVELDLTRKQRDDYRKQAELTKKLLLASNTKLAQYEQHLKALAESVPPQPVILQAIQKESATEAGFRKLVARHFGADIAKRMEVKN